MKIKTIILYTLFLVAAQVSASVNVKNDSVTFSITANTVSKVEVVFKGLAGPIGSDTIALIKGTNSIWKKTIKIPAGFHYYLYLVDGAPICDDAGWAYFGWGTWAGGFDVKDSANVFYDQKTGPFGNVNINYYKSDLVNDYRKCFVYTPAEYDNSPDNEYPVLYLLHDLGEDESAWIYQGKIQNILDNAINNGEILPMLVVLENINAYNRIDGKLTLPNHIDSVISSELVPYIDEHYHTIDSAKYRAIAGCSMGGEIAMDIALNNRDVFGNLGVFSLTSDFDTSQVLVDSIKSADFDLFYLGTGNTDASWSKVSSFNNMLTSNGISHSWDIQNGSYNWLAWRKILYNMTKDLFK
jgi:enterochelin esterase-like enzyme